MLKLQRKFLSFVLKTKTSGFVCKCESVVERKTNCCLINLNQDFVLVKQQHFQLVEGLDECFVILDITPCMLSYIFPEPLPVIIYVWSRLFFCLSPSMLSLFSNDMTNAPEQAVIIVRYFSLRMFCYSNKEQWCYINFNGQRFNTDNSQH
jgi:hypothetical protein